MNKQQNTQQPVAIDRATIRQIFMANGFTSKDGQTDLKPYVYEAAEALLRAQQKEISSLNSRIAKLEKDALRYRKLRSWHWSESDFCVVANPKENVKLGVMCPSGQVLDGLLDLYLEEDKN